MQDEWALVTGGSSGIGLALAKCLAKDGCNILLVARSEDNLDLAVKDIINKYGVHVRAFAYDLSLSISAVDLVNKLAEEGLEVSYLINSAGFGSYGNFAEGKWEVYDRMIGLNITSLTYLCHEFARQMKTRGRGRIMNVSSVAGFLSGPKMAVYYASKAYVLHLSEAMNEELRSSGVSVTALCPGPTSSGFAAAAEASGMGIFKSSHLPSAEQVALYGYRAMLKGKPVAIQGLTNKTALFLSRFASRQFVTKTVGRLQA